MLSANRLSPGRWPPYQSLVAISVDQIEVTKPSTSASMGHETASKSSPKWAAVAVADEFRYH